MPELPEVETITQAINKTLKDKVIDKVEVRNLKSFEGKSDDLKGRKFIGASRRGKTIFISLSQDKIVAIHLKMTGQLIWLPDSKQSGSTSEGLIGGHPDKAYQKEHPHKHTHVIFKFTDGSNLFFNDIRKFGWIRMINKTTMLEMSEKLGPEPLPKVNVKDLWQKIERRPKSFIKNTLLDQKVIAGIGNIYADEALFCSKILPTRRNNSLNQKEISRLSECIVQILERSIRAGGTSRSDYRQLDGSRGGYMDIAFVYGREGQECRRCKGVIKRKKIGQRSSHFCLSCQV